MPGSATTPGRPSACDCALRRVAFRYTDSVSTQKQFSIAAQWLACTYPCRRFTDILANACARLGADVVRYSFIAGDLHPLLLAGLPAHLCENVGQFRIGGSCDPSALRKNRLQRDLIAQHLCAHIIAVFSHSLDPKTTLLLSIVRLPTVNARSWAAKNRFQPHASSEHARYRVRHRP